MTRRNAATQAEALRNSAAALLQKASQSTDLAQRDALTRKALMQIEEARRLLDAAEVLPSRPVKRLH